MSVGLSATYDDSIDTKNMSPEDDFAPINDPTVPKKGGNQITQDGQTVLDSGPFEKESRLPDAFSESIDDKLQRIPSHKADLVGEVDSEPAVNEQTAAQDGQETQVLEEATFPQELLEAAQIDENYAETYFKTPEALQAAIRMLDTRFINEGRQLISTPEQSDDESIEDQALDTQWELPPTADGEEWDQDTLALVQAINERNDRLLAQRDEQIGYQQQLLEQYVQQQNQIESERYLEEFDSMIHSLPDEWIALFGEGTAYELNPNSLAFNNRLYLEQTMNALQQGNVNSGRPLISRDELMVRALAVAFPEQHHLAIQNQVTEQIAERQKMVTARPSARQPSPLTADQKAIQGAEDWYKKHNFNSNIDETNEDL